MNDTSSFSRTGLAIEEHYLSSEESLKLRTMINDFRAIHEIPLIVRESSGRSLRYFVMNGQVIRESCPSLVSLYERVGQTVTQLTGLDLVPIANTLANLNVNITPRVPLQLLDRAIGTDAVRELDERVSAHVLFDLRPVPVLVANFAAIRAHRE